MQKIIAIDQTELVSQVKVALRIKKAEDDLLEATDSLEKKVQEENAALRESETRLREVLENSLDASYKRNLITNAYDYLSPVIARISGYTPDDLKGMPLETFMDLMHPDDPAEIERVIAESISGPIGKAYRVKYRLKHKDGQYRWLHDQFTVLRDAGGRNLALIGSVSDITELTRAEETLRASETRFKTMFNEAPLGIALIDSLTGHFYSVNPMFAKIAGRNMEEMAHIDWMNITHTDDVQEDLDNVALLNVGKIPGFQMEKRYLHHDGTPIWVNMTIAPIYVEDQEHPRHLCMIEDITERKEIEAGLEKARQELAVIKIDADEVNELAENVINTVREPLIALDQDLRVVKVSSSFYEFFKVEPESTVGQLIYDLGNKQWDIPKLRELLETILPQKASFDNYEVEHDFATIGKRTMLLNARQIQRVLGKERIILLAIEDITERKHAEDKLRCVLEELERSNKDLEQFASIASHDLQEPLRMVASYTQLLAERYEGQLDEKAKKYITYAVEGAIRMQRLVNDLLTYSRVSTRGNLIETTDSHSSLGEAIRNLAAAIEESKAIVTNEELPMVRADALQLVQVFQNLLANAIKFRGENFPHVYVCARDEGREWVFSVRDNGIGIDRQYADRIFVIFQRLHTRQEYPGTGIGLAVCKRIVERHGGKIWFESEPGKGATFFFTVPK
jgi:PAS domain S-box-containing protein